MALSFTKSIFKYLNIDSYEKDFKIVFNNFTFQCPTVFAELVSPNISRERKMDPTITSYKVNTNLSDKSIFVKLTELIKGEEIKFEIDDVESELCKVLLLLGNKEVFNAAVFNIITNENVVPLIILKKFYGEKIEEEIEYCAEHFEELKELLSKNPSQKKGNIILPLVVKDSNKKYVTISSEIEPALEHEEILKIMLSNKLVVSNEYSLLEFIKSKMDNNQNSYILLKGIKPQYLTRKQMDEYIEIIDKLPISQIGVLWTSIRERCKYDEPQLNPERFGMEIIRPSRVTTDLIWNGIFYHYQQQNVKPFIRITASSIESGSTQSLITSNGSFVTNNMTKSSIMMQLLKNKIAMNGYTLQSNNSQYPKSWKIEGSNNKIEWTMIDEKNDESCMSSQGAEKFFSCKQANEFTYIRFTQTKTNASNNNKLSLKRIELFGAIGSTIETKEIDLSSIIDPWDGVFSYFRGISNNYASELVTPYCNSTYSGSPNYLLDGSSDFCTNNSSSYYFMFTLNRNKLIINGYTFKSDQSWNWYPTYWKVEGSNDNSNWTVLDQRSNCRDLCSTGLEKTFTFNNSNAFKYFKFSLTSTSNSGGYYFALRRVELFGTLTEQ